MCKTDDYFSQMLTIANCFVVGLLLGLGFRLYLVSGGLILCTRIYPLSFSLSLL